MERTARKRGTATRVSEETGLAMQVYLFDINFTDRQCILLQEQSTKKASTCEETETNDKGEPREGVRQNVEKGFTMQLYHLLTGSVFCVTIDCIKKSLALRVI